MKITPPHCDTVYTRVIYITAVLYLIITVNRVNQLHVYPYEDEGELGHSLRDDTFVNNNRVLIIEGYIQKRLFPIMEKIVYL